MQYLINIGIDEYNRTSKIDKTLTKISTQYAKETTSLTEALEEKLEHVDFLSDEEEAEIIEDINNMTDEDKEIVGKIENSLPNVIEDHEGTLVENPIIFRDKGNREEEYAKQCEIEKLEDEENEYCNKNANCSSCEKQYNGCLHNLLGKTEENINSLTGEEINDVNILTTTNWPKSETTPIEDIENAKNKICGTRIIRKNANSSSMILTNKDKYAKHNEDNKIILNDFEKQLKNAKSSLLEPLIAGQCKDCVNHTLLKDKSLNTIGCKCNVDLPRTHMENCTNYSTPIGKCTKFNGGIKK
jgi:hypothetical protein